MYPGRVSSGAQTGAQSAPGQQITPSGRSSGRRKCLALNKAPQLVTKHFAVGLYLNPGVFPTLAVNQKSSCEAQKVRSRCNLLWYLKGLVSTRIDFVCAQGSVQRPRAARIPTGQDSARTTAPRVIDQHHVLGGNILPEEGGRAWGLSWAAAGPTRSWEALPQPCPPTGTNKGAV
jgi:hypothetical protein